MAKIKRKGTSGNAKNYITRTQAVRKLQISLPDFRRLCIFKGIYPREPRNKKKVSKSASAATTFYYTRDIQYLLHEPLLQKFRDHKALAKKIGRALGRGEVNTANRLEKTQTPKITLDHVIKERYPTFVDALRDLDDALSMLFLFANLPSTATVPPKTIARCQRLCLEFQHYLIVSHSLKKTFLSIKGIYYQATIQGQDVLWVVPYKFVQRMSGDIDFRIMGTFIEFYATLLGFVNYRLYTSLGLVYPPKFDAARDDHGAELGAFTLEGKAIGSSVEDVAQPEQALLTSATSAEAQKLADEASSLAQPDSVDSEMADASNEQQNQVAFDAIDTFEPITEDADVLPQPQVSSSEAASLFANFTFFLSRETPRQPLEFLLKSFGSKRVGWDGVLGEGAFVTDESDPSITHQIVDRPPMYQDALPPVPDAAESKQDGDAPAKSSWPRSKIPGRTYVQPQWVWDCINQGKLLRPDLYGPGVTLPPHLSPWAKAKRGAYDPTLSLAEQEREGEADEHEEEEAADAIEDEESDEEMDDSTKTKKSNLLLDRSTEMQAGEGMDVAETESDSEDEDDTGAAQEDEWDGLPSDEESEVDEAEAARRQHQRELIAEAKGLPLEAAAPKSKAAEAKKKAQRKRRDEEEETDRQKMMLSRKKRKLFEKMQFSSKKTEAEAEKIRGKRRKLEKKGAAPAA